MSIINNAHPGSQIRLLCLIDRVLHRRTQTPINRDELIELLRPANLPKTETAAKRFESNLKFWLEEGLWLEDDTGIRNHSITSTPVNLPYRVLELLVRNAKTSQEMLINGNRGEPFLRGITSLLAQDKHTFFGKTPLNVTNVAKSVGRLSSERAFNESNEAATLLEYGEFLGFLEPFADGYIVDPTRAISAVLPDIFKEKKELAAKDFMSSLNKSLPMLDGGEYRQVIEPLLTAQDWHPLDQHQISVSLSHALLRLELELKIVLETRSDDIDSLQLQTPQGDKRQFSVVSLREKL
ncbi:protein DpdG [Shewanella algae]|uniref:protein DpdG n=1 Tax=Shewanella algae TaxID=38313 RepID=UPI0011831F6C|nr:protein DpdG [Shewanella algae]MBO2643882.1 hypothetical protein [Shewanella algae]QTE95377.1 hypothetical protein JKK45_02050 [Shewanella algae]TVL50795.1 hypothetical protein AYI98_07645 [Shewanella algae]